MDGIVMTGVGGLEVLQKTSLPQPTITAPNQVLIRVKAAGVNPIDLKIRQRGSLLGESYPILLGCDGAGIVEEVGAQVQDFKVGDEVYYLWGGLGQPHTGNYATYAVVPDHMVALKPKNLSFAEAGAVPLPLITAWEALYDRCHLQAGDRVMIQAGAGGVGHLAVQLAKLLGAEVATTVSSQDKASLARKLGADLPIIYPHTDQLAAINEWTGGKGVDVSFDTVGGEVFFTCCAMTKLYGDVATILAPDFTVGDLKHSRNYNLRISLVLMLSPTLLNDQAAQIAQGQILRQASQLFEQHKLSVHLSQTFPLAEAALAHQVIATGSTTGKIALTMD
jgi:NADPH2:quinone reductase